MAKYPRLQRRGSRYFLRAKVPRDLVVVIGKREVIRALETSDFKTAVRRLGIASVEVDAQFAEARRNRPVSGVSPASLRSLALDYFRSLEETATDRYPLLDHEARSQALTNLRDDEIVLSGGEGDAHLASIQSATDGLLSSRGVVLQRGSAEWWSLCELVNRALLEHTRRNRERCGGDFRLKTFDPYFAQVQVRVPAPSCAQASVGEGSLLQISDLLKAWGNETRPATKTLYSWGRILDKLRKHLGHSDAERISRKDIVAWKDALLADGLAPTTVRNHLIIAATVFSWAVKNERLRANPAKGVSVSGKGKVGKRRLPYTDQEAALLLSAARKETGARRWVSWLLAFTGTRLEEVCQALTTDIRKEREIWFIDINADDESKSLKTIGSSRKVPLHPALIEEGFLDYVRGLPANSPLFPDLTPDRFGRRGGNGTKIIGRWVRACGIADPRKAPNHAWRHRFKDQCRAAGIEKVIHDALTGHVSRDTGDGYGLGYPLPVLAGAIAKLAIPARFT